MITILIKAERIRKRKGEKERVLKIAMHYKKST